MNCCRTCMSTTSLNPIFQYVDKSNKYTDILAMTTGLKILINDSLPQVLCTNCVNFINDYQDFRETCQRSHRILTKSIKSDNLLDNDMSLKREIDKQLVTVTAVKIEQTNDFETNNDNFDSNNDDNGHFDCGEEIKNVVIKKNVEFDMSIEDLMKMKIELAINKPKIHKKVTSISKDDKVVQKKKEVEKGDAEERNEEAHSTETVVMSKEEESTDVEATSTLLEEERRDVEDSDAVEARNVLLKCKYCQKVFKKLRSLEAHHKTHTGRNTVCEHCGKKFLSKERLLMHCKSKHGYEKTDKCSYCEFMGSNRYSVQIHERLHTGEKPYVCQKCGASFHRSSTYLQHIAIHLPEKTVQCDQCPARFKSTTLMRIHKNRHRAPQYTFRCRVCDNSFKRRPNVVRHLQRIHGMQDTEQDIERVKINRI